MKYLVTGSAGFIGMHLTVKLLKEGHEVVGLDNLNEYYDVNLKYSRLEVCGIERIKVKLSELLRSNKFPNYQFVRMDLEDRDRLELLFKEEKFDVVINLAAQAGVRYSLENPFVYVQSNVEGFLSLIEACRKFPVEKVLYASSSSVYGLNDKMPFSTEDRTETPISLYAATKKSNELMAHTYSHLFGINLVGLRFFTVYGPYGRPDMALFSFTKDILENKTIRIFNEGRMSRDFTYVDDIVEGVYKLSILNDLGASKIGVNQVYNIGNSKPVGLMDFVNILQEALGKKANIKLEPMQPGDVESTYADVTDLKEKINYSPSTSLEEGVTEFVNWYRSFYEQ